MTTELILWIYNYHKSTENELFLRHCFYSSCFLQVLLVWIKQSWSEATSFFSTVMCFCPVPSLLLPSPWFVRHTWPYVSDRNSRSHFRRPFFLLVIEGASKFNCRCNERARTIEKSKETAVIREHSLSAELHWLYLGHTALIITLNTTEDLVELGESTWSLSRIFILVLRAASSFLPWHDQKVTV